MSKYVIHLTQLRANAIESNDLDLAKKLLAKIELHLEALRILKGLRNE